LIYGQEIYGRHADARAVPQQQVKHSQRSFAKGYEFRHRYARIEKEIRGGSVETLEEKRVTLPERQA
jgi:hypothetical protein